jgi:hypothetical protein
VGKLAQQFLRLLFRMLEDYLPTSREQDSRLLNLPVTLVGYVLENRFDAVGGILDGVYLFFDVLQSVVLVSDCSSPGC